MHPYLTRLGVTADVQEFFEPFFFSDDRGDLCFDYSGNTEHFGFAFHRIPFGTDFWLAGNTCYPRVREVIICSSAMEAISWLNKNYYAYAMPDGLLFISAGAGLSPYVPGWINRHLSGRSFRLVLGRDILGRMADLKFAAGIRRLPVSVYLLPDERIQVLFRSASYVFERPAFSLSALERAAKFRFNIPADKAKGFDSFFEALKAEAGLTF